jgi:hypothetical protein
LIYAAVQHRSVASSLSHSGFQVEYLSLALLAVAVVGLGSAATILLTQSIPQSVSDVAARHGRFAGLSTAAEESGPASPALPYRVHVQSKSIDVVGTSN